MEFASWKHKALPHLRKEEGWNNLFWQIMRTREKSSRKSWAGNIFQEGRVRLSALITPSNFLLLSHGSLRAVEALGKYVHLKKWKLDGVSGPVNLVNQFLLSANLQPKDEPSISARDFKLFQTTSKINPTRRDGYELYRVEGKEWPRARVWAHKFAMEANPPMDLAAITQMAKQMQAAKNLFILKNSENIFCAMAGFGRSTERYQVINMVYVPEELRRKGMAEELLNRMILESKASGYKGCLLFSEWQGSRNLYELMGCKTLGRFVEQDLA